MTFPPILYPGSGVSAPSFSPLNISNLLLWVDASNAGSLTLSGSNVLQWNDLSGR